MKHLFKTLSTLLLLLFVHTHSFAADKITIAAAANLRFDRIWEVQASFDPDVFNEQARLDLRDTLLYQRKLRSVRPGRCVLLPSEDRAPLALPISQRFRIYQEVNNLRIQDEYLREVPLTLEQ